MSDMKGLFCLRCGLPLEKAAGFCSDRCKEATQEYLDRLTRWRKELKEEFLECQN